MRGSCLCGSVHYAIDRLDLPITHCHCVTCRKAHASAYATTAGVLRSHFRWLEGADSLRAFESSPGKIRWFCGTCGTHLIADRPAQPHVLVRVATLDADPGRRPELHIWTAQAVPWLVDDEATPHHPEWPPGR